MKRSRFSEEQIIGILMEHRAGLSAAELCRKHDVSEPTFYKWRSKYFGLEVSDAKRLRALEEENAKLKKLLVESMMDVSTLREMLRKKTSEERRVEWHYMARGNHSITDSWRASSAGSYQPVLIGTLLHKLVVRWDGCAMADR
jgi:putative transposase